MQYTPNTKTWTIVTLRLALFIALRQQIDTMEGKNHTVLSYTINQYDDKNAKF
jgi:hypothetical protein